MKKHKKNRPFWGGMTHPLFFWKHPFIGPHGYQPQVHPRPPIGFPVLKKHRGKTASQTHLSKGRGRSIEAFFVKGWAFFSGILQVFWVVVLNIFYFHPYLGKWSNLTNIFQMGWNHQLVFLWERSGKNTNKKHHHWFTKKTAPERKARRTSGFMFFFSTKCEAEHPSFKLHIPGLHPSVQEHLVWCELEPKRAMCLKICPKMDGFERMPQKGPRNYYGTPKLLRNYEATFAIFDHLKRFLEDHPSW